ncbi:MAG: tetratricopeptide repeat protein [Holosporales bacterium]|jgi:hypothetical protein|nr:tetratricopeptide repeat protein [Holosporales bacterium]
MDDKKNDSNTSAPKFDVFVESIEEEIRNENWQMLWNKYGKLVSCVFVGCILSVGVYNMWKQRTSSEIEAISHRYSMVQNLLNAGHMDQALPQIKELASSAKEPYKTLSKMMYAAILREKGDKAAIDQYKQISEDKKADKMFQELAYILYVNTCIDLMPPKDIMKELDGFIENLSTKCVNGVWEMFAIEALAFCYIKDGKNDLAKEVLLKLAKTPEIPQSMGERARDLANMF